MIISINSESVSYSYLPVGIPSLCQLNSLRLLVDPMRLDFLRSLIGNQRKKSRSKRSGPGLTLPELPGECTPKEQACFLSPHPFDLHLLYLLVVIIRGQLHVSYVLCTNFIFPEIDQHHGKSESIEQRC